MLLNPLLPLLTLWTLVSALPAPAGSLHHVERAATKVDDNAFNAAIKRGAGILGEWEGFRFVLFTSRALRVGSICTSACPYAKCTAPTCSWMKTVSGTTKITDLSIPGTHDSASWNYTPLTQLMYLKYTGFIYPSPVYKCQRTSLLTSLTRGVRALDLRVGSLPAPAAAGEAGFWHSEALLDEGARFDDVLCGLWRWLDENPTEALFVSIKIENTTFGSDAAIQQSLYSSLTSPLAASYVHPTTTLSGLALSSVRGKMVLLRRFALDTLPPSAQANGLGLNLYEGWSDNDADFTIAYSGEKAYVEDLYEPDAKPGITSHVKVKLGATTSHLAAASTRAKGEGLYITFGSSEKAGELLMPQVMAQGLIVPGVNQGLKRWLTGEGKGLKNKGLVFLDFATETSGLIDAIIA